MASIGPLGQPDDDKKSSFLAKMGGMVSAARRDGQAPKRWIWSPEFLIKVASYLTDDNYGIATALMYTPEKIIFFGLPVTVDATALHECVLDVE